MIVVVAKQPLAGQVKTRLIGGLTPEQVASLFEAMLRRTVDEAREADAGEVALGFTPAEGRQWFEAHFPGLRLLEQGEGDLGERMARLFELAFQSGQQHVALIGADAPYLPPETYREAMEKLREGAELVIGPADDGGYYLIGLNRPMPCLFANMPWSSKEVLPETLRRAEQAGIAVTLLPLERDIDTPQDLEWLYSQPGFEWFRPGYELPVADKPTAADFPYAARPRGYR